MQLILVLFVRMFSITERCPTHYRARAIYRGLAFSGLPTSSECLFLSSHASTDKLLTLRALPPVPLVEKAEYRFAKKIVKLRDP